jgi:uncharacterized protein
MMLVLALVLIGGAWYDCYRADRHRANTICHDRDLLWWKLPWKGKKD